MRKGIMWVAVCIIVVAVLSFGLVACGSKSSSEPAPSATAATLASIAVTPANPSIAAAATQQFTATGTYSDLSTANITTSVIWTSSTATAATISVGGLATGVAAGTTTITATSGGVSGNTILTVTAAGGFTWTENGSATLQTAGTANFSTQFKTLKAFNGTTLLFEINLDGTIPATYVLNGTTISIAYTKVTPFFIPTAGDVVITANSGGVISGTFQGTGNNGAGITSVAGTFTNIPVVP